MQIFIIKDFKRTRIPITCTLNESKKKCPSKQNNFKNNQKSLRCRAVIVEGMKEFLSRLRLLVIKDQFSSVQLNRQSYPLL